jgi:beta-N-acetylhexosaminidase
VTAVAAVVAAVVAGSVALSGGGGDGDPAATAERPAAELRLDRLAGQRLIAGWDGARVPRGLELLIRQGRVAGVILFEDNVPSPAAAGESIARLQELDRPDGLEMPLLVMVDQEGGQVKRLDGPPAASAAEMGVRGSEYARRQGELTGESLAEAGFNVDLAPVLDVGRPGSAIEGEQRAFGASPADVVAVGVEAFTAGLRSRGIAATAKHFPGLGAAETNTDFASQEIRISKQELRAGDELPFEAFAAAGGELVMLSLATYPAFSDRPAAFSRKVVSGELQGRLGFEGVSITDGLGAAAAQAFGSRGEVALAATEAGNDLLLYTDWRDARDVGRLLTRKLRDGALDREEFERSAARVLDLRTELGG